MTATIDPHEYNITLRKIVFEGETMFEARVKELPDVRGYGETLSEAYEIAIDSIETSAEVFAISGRPFPTPIVPQDDFSGRITLRVPKNLHRMLSFAAEDQGISLNQFLVNVLAYRAGVTSGHVLIQQQRIDDPDSFHHVSSLHRIERKAAA